MFRQIKIVCLGCVLLSVDDTGLDLSRMFLFSWVQAQQGKWQPEFGPLLLHGFTL